MNIMRTNLSRILKFNNIKADHVKNLRKYVSNEGIKYNKSGPVSMAYASYESTGTPNVETVPPIILMHGLFGSKSNWNSICKAMQRMCKPTRKIIAVDARNHGESPHTATHAYEDLASDIKQLMERQRIKKACLMGHSMGGKAVMYFTLKYPELVDRLIVVDISPFTEGSFMDDMFSYFDIMYRLKLEPNLPLSTARRQADVEIARIIRDKGIRAFILTNLIQKNDGSYAWRINIPTLKSEYPKLTSFPDLDEFKYNGKTLFIYGGESSFLDTDHFPLIKNIFPEVEFKTIEEAGHWVHSEKPNEFLSKVVSFLNADS